VLQDRSEDHLWRHSAPLLAFFYRTAQAINDRRRPRYIRRGGGTLTMRQD
jgi:hypothetical protein